jgi:hypothetical protein
MILVGGGAAALIFPLPLCPALNREVDPLIDAYVVFRPRDYSERDELAQAFGKKAPPTQISKRIRARVAKRIDV